MDSDKLAFWGKSLGSHRVELCGTDHRDGLDAVPHGGSGAEVLLSLMGTIQIFTHRY